MKYVSKTRGMTEKKNLGRKTSLLQIQCGADQRGKKRHRKTLCTTMHQADKQQQFYNEWFNDYSSSFNSLLLPSILFSLSLSVSLCFLLFPFLILHISFFFFLPLLLFLLLEAFISRSSSSTSLLSSCLPLLPSTRTFYLSFLFFFFFYQSPPTCSLCSYFPLLPTQYSYSSLFLLLFFVFSLSLFLSSLFFYLFLLLIHLSLMPSSAFSPLPPTVFSRFLFTSSSSAFLSLTPSSFYSSSFLLLTLEIFFITSSIYQRPMQVNWPFLALGYNLDKATESSKFGTGTWQSNLYAGEKRLLLRKTSFWKGAKDCVGESHCHISLEFSDKR